ncbi:Acyl-CoA N-acyltransferase [Penicillium taxi]|uniref:Acyl-CoA N-acyltransferase n=1 Tax=Penicillium taxi TaxID=168475 RepID=UPI00254548CB|nr:Acyl-CoA N-acyltransferase [Penicillium taxi]KAJ5900014.1 Acyl-CoA N-acyltransferase [Penicillium taxi]
MSFEISPATSSDAPQLTEVFLAAFSDDLNRKMFPLTQDVREWVAEHLFSSSDSKLNEVFLKVTDPLETGKVVAFAKWIQPTSADSDIDTNQHEASVTWPTSSDKDLCTLFFGMMEASHHRLMGNRPHFYLDILGVHPSYQGRGLAGKLLRWGLERADEQGVEVYLNATPSGRPVYAKHGFQALDSFSPVPDYEQLNMIRPSRK